MASSPAGRGRSRRPGLIAIVVLPILLASCGALHVTPEPATPTSFPGLAGRLNTAHVEVRDWVSGDAGCTDPDLVPSAISFMATGLDQAEPVKLYLYIFRDRAAFEKHRDQIGACAGSFVTDPQTYEEVEQSPYVVAGQGPWAPLFEAALRATLATAAGTGG
jgi:hypothetical protein